MTAELALTLVMLLTPYVAGWLILLLKPRWTFVFAFAAAMMVFGLPAFLSSFDPFVGALHLLARGALFVVVGGPIVALGLWIRHVRDGAANAGNRTQ